MTILLAGISLKARAGLLKQFGHHGQVNLRIPQAQVPKVNGEVVYQPLYICSLSIPFRQPMDGKGVAQIMHPGLEAASVGTPQAGLFS
jgi:hypothetical protein